MVTRRATHAGSWYIESGTELSRQLDGWLNAVPSSSTPIGTTSSKEGDVAIPTSNVRAIIAPHAGYSYSGPAAAWAYKSADWAHAKRVFLLGPSHHYYLSGVATTGCDKYGTPLGNLTVDTGLVGKIKSEWSLETMSTKVDEDEHSLEMHLPYIYKMLSSKNEAFKNDPASVPLVPLLVGNTDARTEAQYGARLAPYLSDPSNLFVISSDFCHWGSRFRYTYYEKPDRTDGKMLRSNTGVLPEHPIHESIATVDQDSMDMVETGSHSKFLAQLEDTGNTVCGRHPIGLFMAAVEKAEGMEGGKGKFKFLRYERSSLVESVRDSSVSYCSAFAVL